MEDKFRVLTRVCCRWVRAATLLVRHSLVTPCFGCLQCGPFVFIDIDSGLTPTLTLRCTASTRLFYEFATRDGYAAGLDYLHSEIKVPIFPILG